MWTIITKVNLDELPEVLLDIVNLRIQKGYRFLGADVMKFETENDESFLDYRVNLNNEGLFIQLDLTVNPYREPLRDDVKHSMISASTILFFIENDDALYRRVSELVNEKEKG